MSEFSLPDPEESRLRGSLAPKDELEEDEQSGKQESSLRGSLVRQDTTELGERDDLPTSLLHRDSGDTYKVVEQTDTRYGVMVKLQAPDGHTTTKSRDSLMAAINEEGAPWSRPESSG